MGYTRVEGIAHSMEILIGIASWSFVALFLSIWFILPGWVVNGAKKEELKSALTMIAMLFVFLFCAFMLAEIF